MPELPLQHSRFVFAESLANVYNRVKTVQANRFQCYIHMAPVKWISGNSEHASSYGSIDLAELALTKRSIRRDTKISERLNLFCPDQPRYVAESADDGLLCC